MIGGIRQVGAIIRQELDGSELSFLRALTLDPGETTKKIKREGHDDALPDDERAITDLVEAGKGVRKRGKGKSSEQKDTSPRLVTVSIDTSRSEIEVDPSFELDRARAREILWLGNVKANDDQDRFVTGTLAYLISQTIPNVARSCFAPENLKDALSALFPSHYRDFGERAGSHWRYVLDLSRFGIGLDWLDLEQTPINKCKDRCNKVASLLLEKSGVSMKAPALFALKLNGQLLSSHPGYHTYLFRRLVSQYFAGAEIGVCHLCGCRGPVTMKLKELRFKAYITDKVNFAAGVRQEGFRKNYRLCQPCYESLLLGERFTGSQLRQNLLRTTSYVIPEFSRPEHITQTGLRRAAQDTVKKIDDLKRIGSVSEFGSRIDRKQEFYQLTIVMVDTGGMTSKWKVLELIPEVPPSRIDKVIESVSVAQSWAEKLFGERHFGWLGGLEDLPFLLPIGKSRDGWKVRPALAMAKHLILEEPPPLQSLIGGFLQVARARHYGSESFVAMDEEEIYILRTLTFLRFLRELRLIQMTGERATVVEIDEPYANVLNELAFNVPQRAVFMLGVLLARVASEQYKASRPSPSGTEAVLGRGDNGRSTGGSKPVLEKVNYHGMSLMRVRQFSVDIFDKLRQYRRLTDSERDWTTAKLLLEAEATRWPLSDQDNVYYLLTGYAYETRLIMTSGKSKQGAE